MNESAPTKSTVPKSIAANVRSLVKSVPDVCGVCFFSARKPAIAIGKRSAGKTAEQEDHSRGDVPCGIVVGQSLKTRTVVGRGRREFVERLR